MANFIISDLHFGHKNIATKFRNFETIYQHDDYIIESINSIVDKKDKLFILGDITMGSIKNIYKLGLLNGYKHVVLGNHDIKNKDYIIQMLNFAKVSGTIPYKIREGFEVLLSHYPLHPLVLSQEGYKMNIHGHIHNVYSINDKRYLNVSAEVLNYKPININNINIED